MDSKIKPRLLELLASHPVGLSTSAAQKLLNVSQNGVCRAARALAADGQVALMRHSYQLVMSLPEHAPATRMRLRDERDAKANADKLRKAEWYRRHVSGEEDDRPDIDEPTIRVVPAAEAKPLRKRGVSSVFELGMQ